MKVVFHSLAPTDVAGRTRFGYLWKRVFVSRILLVGLALATLLRGESQLTGRVVDESETPVARATVTARLESSTAPPAEALTDPTGAFSLSLPGPGDYLVTVHREGFYELQNRPVHVEASAEVTLTLNPVREVFQSVDVTSQPSAIDPSQTSLQRVLTGTEINDVPYPSSHSLRNSMKLIPGVIQDPSGALHFDGSAENQVLYLLNGFNVGDPLTGRFNTDLAVEGIRSLDFSSGRFSPEYGKGSAGVLQIRTDTGTDQLRYTATNFVPGVATQGGLHLGAWTPRAGISGPLMKGRAWFADNVAMIYDPALVTDLPPGQNQRTTWIGSNLLHAQMNLTPSNILFADFLVNLELHDHAGLSPLDPVPTTTDQHAHEYFGSIKDQIYLSSGILVEVGYAHNQFFNRQTPQGTDPYLITPTGRSGNYFVQSDQNTRRDQLLASAYLPAFHLGGEHRLRLGTDLDRLGYSADYHRTSYQQIGLSGEVLSITTFQGSGAFSRPNAEASSYVLDNWQLRSNLHIDVGVRQDWDELVRQVVLSPRVSFAYSPFALGNTRISGGYAITYDATNLTLFTQPLDQQSVTTYYNPDGSVAGPPAVSRYVIDGPLKMPRAQNWSASVDQRLPRRIYLSANYLRRRSRDGFTYTPELDGAFHLTNLRNDQYDSENVIVRQSLPGGYQWMVSYTHSSAISNAVFNYTVDQTMQVLNNFGALPWDAPNRFLASLYLPLPKTKKWAIAAMVDWRTGFPFSVVDQSGVIVGPVDSYRYPVNFDLNLHLERQFTLRNHRFAIRAGFNNITDHANPTVVNNVIGSPQFLQFSGDEGRHLVLRIRFFGRQTGI